MTLNSIQITERIEHIKNLSDSNSKFYGKLVNWYSHGAWHYGIGLSNDYIFDLGQNLDTFHKGDRQIKLVIKVKQFPPNKTIQRLIHSLSCFKDWNYGLLGWNCEHYSRLVATNEAISYQVKKSLLAFLNHGGYHPTAVEMLTSYLERLGLSALTSFEEEKIENNQNEKVYLTKNYLTIKNQEGKIKTNINPIYNPQLRDLSMNQCLNPDCLAQNPENHRFCQKCGSSLLLRNRYQALKLIGQGGFGKTFLAIDHDKPKKPYCVIKQFFLQSQGTEETEKAAELFAQEALRLDELGKHSQIPELLAYFIHDDQRQYLVQEYIPGQNLEQELKSQGNFNEAKIQQLLEDLLPVLDFIHQHQVIHRDIKPENIIRRERDNKLVVVDFGAAKAVTSLNRSVTGTMIGSAEYVAPEQMNGKPVNASDLYSLGVTCLYLLTGVSPFELFDSGDHEWVWRQYLVNNFVNDNLGNILDKLVTFGTKKRYPSVGEVLQDLNQKPIAINNVPIQISSQTKRNKGRSGYVDYNNQLLDELDLLSVKSAASFFENFPEKIIRYHQDHHATIEEARVIADYYLKMAECLRTVKTLQDVKDIIDKIENLKRKISRYQHDDHKYRWTKDIDKNALDRLKSIKG
jgi:hypothetical protein